MTDIAHLGFSTDTSTVKEGTVDLDRLGDQAAKTERQVKRSATSVTRSAKAMGVGATQASRGFSSMSASLRPISLQLSQVAQQGQVTGNYMQALSVQAADIGLAFGTVGIAAGVLAGLLLPVMTNLFTGADAGRQMEDALADLSTATDQYISSAEAASVPLVTLIEKYGEAAGAARELLLAKRDLAEFDAQAALLDATSTITDSIGDITLISDEDMARFEERTAEIERLRGELIEALGAEGSIEAYERISAELQTLQMAPIQGGDQAILQMQEQVENLGRQFGATEADAVELLGAIHGFQSADGFAQQAEAGAALAREIFEATGGVEGMDEATRTLYRSLIDASEQAALLSGVDVGAQIRPAVTAAGSLATNLSSALGFARALSGVLASIRAGAASVGGVISGQFDGVSQPSPIEMLNLQGQYAAYGQGQSAMFAANRAAQYAVPDVSVASGGGSAPSGGGGGGGGVSAEQELHNERLREAERIYDAARTEVENYAAELADLNELYQMGYLDTEAFTRAQEELQAQLMEAQYGVYLDYIRDISDGIGDAIGQADSFADAWRNLADVARSSLQQIASDLISSGLEALFTQAFSTLVGGTVGSPVTGKLAGGSSYTSAGIFEVGEQGKETVALPQGSKVYTASQTRSMNASQPINISIDARGADPSVIPRIEQAARDGAIAGYRMVEKALASDPAFGAPL